ncbi:Arc family DNA-binding protein [Acinetobacter baumannii]|uniref:Arc family DNA-binding protein n=1 Tax=Acinetobacter baumannii TaxID=470 RepID=UPI002949D85D|nr:Arc family DNA-binding protein [Acinetobacter baumannii]MDV5262434.1 Arc family DNA-binding protein [Acinetobacter baumannii]
MSEDVQFNLRIPAELKQQIVEAAKKNSRSINAEAQLRLEKTFELDNLPEPTSPKI